MSHSGSEEPNPYAAPAEVLASFPLSWSADGALIIPKGRAHVRLPMICWVSGSTDDLVSRKVTLYTMTRLARVALAFSVLGPVCSFVVAKFFGIRFVALGVLVFHAGLAGVTILMRRTTATVCETQAVRRGLRRRQWKVFSSVIVALIIGFGAGIAFGRVAGMTSVFLGCAGVAVLAKYRISRSMLSTEVRSVGVALRGFSKAFHAARQRLDQEG